MLGEMSTLNIIDMSHAEKEDQEVFCLNNNFETCLLGKKICYKYDTNKLVLLCARVDAFLEVDEYRIPFL
jgi:hypothetical protein